MGIRKGRPRQWARWSRRPGRRTDRGRSTRILATLHVAAELLERALTPEHAAWIALVALTAGEGFGLNRAFLLRRRDDHLEGWLGVGPRSGEEAARLWHELKSLEVRPLAAAGTFQPEVIAEEQRRLAGTLEALAMPIRENCQHLHRAFLARRDHPDPCVRRWVEVLQSPFLLVLPMVRQGAFWGVMLADNFVTRAPISGPLLEGAQTLAHNLQAALERTELWARYQKEREARKHAEQSVALLEAARALAHDIKNPLVAAAGLLQHLLHNPPATTSEWEGWGQKIAEGLSRVEARVNQLVEELARRGQGVELTRTDPGGVVRRVVESWQPLAESRRITLCFREAERALQVWADPVYLERCVENLVSNAVKAVGLGGEVRVSVEEEGEWVRVAVADNGEPLPQGWRQNPFAGGPDAFGAGEGLASVRRLTEAMGGKVEYDEREPGWVRFSLLLRRCV